MKCISTSSVSVWKPYLSYPRALVQNLQKKKKKAIVCFLVVGVILRIFDLDVIIGYYAYQECVVEIVQDSLHTEAFHKGSYLIIGSPPKKVPSTSFL